MSEAPDFFSFYAHEIANLLSQNEDILSSSNASELSQGKRGLINGTETLDCKYDDAGLFIKNSISAGLSELKKGRLKALLRQGVNTLSMEVDEMLDPVLNMCQLRYKLKGNNMTPELDSNVVQGVSKRQKMSSCASSIMMSKSSLVSGSCEQVEDDLQFLLKNDNQQLVEETVKKYCDELCSTLLHMEQKLEETLDVVTTKCRPMTPIEKQELQKLIQKLPRENLTRVVEIIQRGRPVEKSCSNEIFVDLQREENITLWRLYYYVEAVKKARMLANPPPS